MTDLNRWIDTSPLEGWDAFSKLAPVMLDLSRAFTDDAAARFIASVFGLSDEAPVAAAPMNHSFSSETWGHDLQAPFSGPFSISWGERHLRLDAERGVKRIDAQFTEEQGQGGGASTLYRIYDKARQLAVVLDVGYTRLAVAAPQEEIERVRVAAENALQFATWPAQIDCDLQRLDADLLPSLKTLLKTLDPQGTLQSLAVTLRNEQGWVAVDVDPAMRVLRANVHGLHTEVRGAEAFLKQHLGLKPTADLDASILEMRTLFAQGRSQAARMAKDILAEVPDQPDARMIRAIALVEPDLLNGIDVDPYELAVVRGFLAEFEHHYDAAIKHWEEAHRLRPADPVAGVHLGTLLWTKQMPPDTERVIPLLLLGVDHPAPPDRLDVYPPDPAPDLRHIAEVHLNAIDEMRRR